MADWNCRKQRLLNTAILTSKSLLTSHMFDFWYRPGSPLWVSHWPWLLFFFCNVKALMGGAFALYASIIPICWVESTSHEKKLHIIAQEKFNCVILLVYLQYGNWFYLFADVIKATLQVPAGLRSNDFQSQLEPFVIFITCSFLLILVPSALSLTCIC